jgi:hypothetical protein
MIKKLSCANMKRGAKKTGNRMEEGAEEAKDKVD